MPPIKFDIMFDVFFLSFFGFTIFFILFFVVLYYSLIANLYILNIVNLSHINYNFLKKILKINE
jgi:hypothetical protein